MRLHVMIAAVVFPFSVAHAQNTELLRTTIPQSPRSLPSPGSLSLTPQLGTEIKNGSVVAKSGSQTLAAGTYLVDGVTVTVNTDTTISSQKKRFQDVYERPIIAGLGATYGLSSEAELFGGVRVVYARGKDSKGLTYSGDITVNGNNLAGTVTSTVKPSDYKSFGIDAGYRRFFPQGGRVTPYLGALVGVQTTDATDIKETLLGVSGKARLYDASITPSVGLQAGVTYEFESGGSIGIETGLRFDGKRKGNDKDLFDSSVNDTGGRYSIPVMFTGRIPLKPENLQK